MGKSGAFWAGLILLAALAGCGPSEPANPEDFIGNWQYSSAAVTYHCMGQSDPVEGDLTVEQGTDTDLLLTFNDCAFGYDLGVGDQANAGPQSCGDPDVLELKLSDGKLNSDGATMEQTERGIAVIFGSECNYTLNGTLTRM